jgi:hypothetical protein
VGRRAVLILVDLEKGDIEEYLVEEKKPGKIRSL